MSTTRWVDTQVESIDDAIKLLTDEVATDDKSKNIYWDNWKIDKIFDDNESIKLNKRDIQYNMIKCEYDQISNDDRPIEDRTVHKNAFIIVYHNGSSVNYIIDQKSNAQKMLRKLLSYGGKNEIGKNMYSLENDFFVWLISKVYNNDNIIESNKDDIPNLQLDSIKGFKGDTEDSQTKVSATGESVMNIISTLSFLLESRRLNQIRLELSREKHESISLILNKEDITIDLKSYQGCFEDDPPDKMIAKLYLLAYLEVLPIIEQEYQSNVDDNIWSKKTYIEFMNNVAKNLTEKVKLKVNAININEE